MRAPEHLSRHPFGRVPVLQHDGFSLYEARPFCAISTGCCRTRR
jgi:glutathione S-transferase